MIPKTDFSSSLWKMLMPRMLHANTLFRTSLWNMFLGSSTQACSSSGDGEEKESVELCYALWMGESQLVWVQKTLLAQLSCAVARTHLCPMRGVCPHHGRLYFFPFKAVSFVDSSPTLSTLSLLYREQLACAIRALPEGISGFRMKAVLCLMFWGESTYFCIIS